MPEFLDLHGHTAKALRALTEAEMRRHGLHYGQDLVLAALWERDGSTPGEVAAALHVTTPTIVKMATRMAAAGQLTRRRDDRDNRLVRLYLTDAGKALREPVLAARQSLEERVTAGLTEPDRERLVAMLATVYQAASQLLAESGGHSRAPGELRILILAVVFGVMPMARPPGPRLALQARPAGGSSSGSPANSQRRSARCRERAAEGRSTMEYERGRKDGVPSNVGPKPTFTGNAMQDALLDDGDKGEIRVYSVIFEPGARTYWHSHASGQTLLISSGEGMVETRDGDKRVVRAGDVVWAPPGEVHWHGAAPDAFLSHTAVSLGLTSWAEEVDEGHYRDAFEGR